MWLVALEAVLDEARPREELVQLLAAEGVRVEVDEIDGVDIYGADPMEIARTALEHRVLIYELTPKRASLEEAYMELTKDDVEYQSLVLTEKSA